MAKVYHGIIPAMLKPIRWKTFPRDFLVIQIGFALFGVSLALMIRANLGTGAWSVFEVALATRSGLTPGTLTLIVGATVFFIAAFLRESFGWGTLANILFIGAWEDLFLYLIPSVNDRFFIQLIMLLCAVMTQGVASAVYIGVNAGAGPRDSLMLAVHRTMNISIQVARGIVEASVFVLGWILGGPAGIGTLIFTVLIGFSVQWNFKLFHVQPHKPEEIPASSE